MSKLREIDMSGTAIVEVPSSIEHLNGLEYFGLSLCENLVSLPESIFNLRSLETLDVVGCSKLERLVVLTNEDASYSILKGGVIWSNNCFSSLNTLNLQSHQMEAEAPNHPILPLSSLVELSVRNSWYRPNFSDGFHLSSLKVLSVGNFNPVARGLIFNDIFLQSSLRRLSLHNCNLMEEGIIPTNTLNLSSLVSLSLSNCNLMDGDILNHICHLSSLKELSLEGNHFSSIPDSFNRLSNLRGLNLSHCKQLRDIPKLPSSLLFLNAHCSDSISSSPSLVSLYSKFNRFEMELTEVLFFMADCFIFINFFPCNHWIHIVQYLCRKLRFVLVLPSSGEWE